MLEKYAGPLLIAFVALAATVATLAPAVNGPGVTCDELYHTAMGKSQVTALRQQGFAFFKPENIAKNYPWQPDGPPVQAPLGYWILGWTHHLFDPAPNNPGVLSIPAARFAPAAAFALLVLMIGAWTARREGPLAGCVAAAAVLFMPRLFGHAHLAALDMLTTLFFVAAVLAVTEAVRGGRFWQFALAGAVWGAAVLVRLHGLLLAPPVVMWLVWRLFFQNKEVKGSLVRGLMQIAVWASAGVATVFVGWPWLWLGPVERFRLYLSSGTARQPINVFYAGQVWADRDVPWHYPWVMFAVTVPVGLLLLGMLGLWAKSRKKWKLNAFGSEGVLLGGVMAFVLLVFSWPGVPVYDGERLFLMAFPFWTIFVGCGAAWFARSSFLESCLAGGLAHRVWGQRFTRRASSPAKHLHTTTALVLAFVALQCVGIFAYFPCHLSYYNLLIGGLAGAERLGFEPTYWGDTVREPLLAEAARRAGGEPVLYLPNLAPFQVPAVEMNSPSLQDAKVRLVGWDSSKSGEAAGCRYVIVYHRRADLPQAEWFFKHGKVVAEHDIQGVWLASLLELKAPFNAASMSARIDGLP